MYHHAAGNSVQNFAVQSIVPIQYRSVRYYWYFQWFSIRFRYLSVFSTHIRPSLSVLSLCTKIISSKLRYSTKKFYLSSRITEYKLIFNTNIYKTISYGLRCSHCFEFFQTCSTIASSKFIENDSLLSVFSTNCRFSIKRFEVPYNVSVRGLKYKFYTML